MLDLLRSEGAVVSVGHSAENLDRPRPPDIVVYSKAIPDTNPELAASRDRGLVTMHRAELLGHLMESRQAVCVCGTHGKTTTTAMLTAILTEVGQDPAMMLGGEYGPLGGNVRNGHGQVFVAEACEAYDSFLSLYPEIAVVTNVEPDHLDERTTFDHIRQSFRTFLGRIPECGMVVACSDSPEVVSLIPDLRSRVETYGLRSFDPAGAGVQSPTWTVRSAPGPGYTVFYQDERVANLSLQVPGEHNLSNALGAIAAANTLGVPPADSAAILGSFAGVDRRFSVRGVKAGVMVVDDYAHHPSEVRATLAAARSLMSARAAGCPSRLLSASEFRPFVDSRLIAAFQPHLYSRTAQFMAEFADSFEDADVVVITEIYGAREQPIPGIDGMALAHRVCERWPEKTILFVKELTDLPERVANLCRAGDMALTLGAGDITTVGAKILARIREGGGED